MAYIQSKEDYIKAVAQQFNVTTDIIEAIAYGEEKVVEDRMALDILSCFINEPDLMIFAMVWKGSALPGGLNNIRSYEYIGQIMQGLHIFLHKTDYVAQLFLTNSLIADTSYFRRLLQARPNAGFIIIGAETIENLQTVCDETDRPIIFVNYPTDLDITDRYLISVQTDEVMREVVTYLHQIGHRHIAFIHGLLNHKVGLERLNEYHAAMDAVGLAVNPEWVVGGDWEERGGYSAGQQLFTLENKPTAIIASNDRMALGTMQAASEMGIRIPQDVSIVGFDNIADSVKVAPSLATVHQPMTRIGSTVGTYMIELLEGNTPEPRHLYLPVEFIIRDSIDIPYK